MDGNAPAQATRLAAKGLPFLGQTVSMLRSPFGLLDEVYHLADLVDCSLGGRDFVFVNRPELAEELLVTRHRSVHKDWFLQLLSEFIGRGLLTSEGDFWRRQRRLAQPAFHRERIASYGESMVVSTEKTIAHWTDGDRRDVHEDFMKLTLEVVAQTLFGAAVEDDANEVAVAIEAVMAHFSGLAFMLEPLRARLPFGLNRDSRLEEARRSLDTVVYKILTARRAEIAEGKGGDRKDLLAMLLAARDEDGSGMSDQQLRDEVLVLFLAGHETTALALSWAFFLLSRHPHVVQALETELDTVLGGRAPTVADVPKLVLTNGIVQETLRLYPPAWSIGREAIEPIEIGGHVFPKGTQFWIPTWSMQRDAKFFPQPERFDPWRWQRSPLEGLPKFVYHPFGGGPRLCIGNQFALLEAALVIATVAQRFRVKIAPEYYPHPILAITLRPSGGMPAFVQKR